MKRDTLVSPSYASAAFRLHATKGPGKQSKRYRANFSARRTTVWRNPAHVGLWRCVHCAKNSAGVNKAGYPSVGTRRRSMIKANARCLTVVSAINEYWHRKFRHVRYVWFAESLQKHSKFIAKSSSRGLGSQQWSHQRYNSTVSRSVTRRLWVNTYVRSHLGRGTDTFSSVFAGLTNISRTQKRCK